MRLEKSMQTKENLMEKLDLVDMFVQIKVIECKIKEIISQCPRAETRTDYQVRIGLILDQEKGNYKVTD